MGIQKLLSYYQNNTNKYANLVNNQALKLIGPLPYKKFIDAEYIDGSVQEILQELPRINKFDDENIPITDNEIIKHSDNITMLLKAIHEDLENTIESMGFKLIAIDGGVKLKKVKK